MHRRYPFGNAGRDVNEKARRKRGGRRFLRLGAVFLFLLLSGCVHLATEQEKEASFRPYIHVHVGRVPLREYIEARTGVLVAGAVPLQVTSDKDAVGVRLKPTQADGAIDVGSAAAVSSDGYYLTASHCVRRRPVFLVIPTPAGPQAYQARVVWTPPTDDPQCDLAILKIDAAPAAVFAIAPPREIHAGAAIVTSGANGEAGGHLVSITKSNELPPIFYTLVHNVPLTHGDSGGPLILLDGRLIGVEVLIRGSYLGGDHGVALLPDPTWLRGVLAHDRVAP